MILAHSLDELNLAKSWLTIGVFDGVHRGHQQIIQQLTAGAHGAGAAAVVVTFWPHPASVLTDREVKCLTMPDERSALLGALGVDVVIAQTFDRELANTSAPDFVGRLKQHLGFDHLLIGYDFALGKGREGDAARLAQLGMSLGYETNVIPALSDESGVISSTEIRKLVAIGDVAVAGTLLILGNCCAYALYLVVSKPVVERLSPARVISLMFGIGVFLMLPISLSSLLHEPWQSIPRAAWISLLLVIAGPTVIAYLLNAWTLRHADSSVVAAYIYVQPVLTTIMAWLVLHETIRPVVGVAALMIFAGVGLAGRSVNTEPPTPVT